MGEHEAVEQILAAGVISIVWLPAPDNLLPVLRAIRDGGVSAIDLSLTTPDAIRCLESARNKLDRDSILGVGDVLTAEAARQAIRAGAQFLSAPNFDPAVVRLCREAGIPVIPGALTASEIVGSWEAGASLVKVFPAGPLGPQYIRTVHESLPHISLLPAGGVSLDTVAAYIQAGAAALGVGSDIVSQALIERQAYGEITSRARAFVEAVKAARGRPVPPPPPIKPVEGPDIR